MESIRPKDIFPLRAAAPAVVVVVEGAQLPSFGEDASDPAVTPVEPASAAASRAMILSFALSMFFSSCSSRCLSLFNLVSKSQLLFCNSSFSFSI